MSKHYPWLKVWKDTKRSPKIRKMPLEQQAVFYNLLQHSGLQEEEGAFAADNLAELALEVADEREDVLRDAIAHLLKYKVLQTLEDGRLAFTNYHEHQATKQDINAERQRRFYQNHKDDESKQNLTHPNANVRNLTRPNAPLKDRDKEKDVEGEGDVDGEEGNTRLSRLQTVCKRLLIANDDGAEELVESAIPSLPVFEDPVLVASMCRNHYGASWSKKSMGQRAACFAQWCTNRKGWHEEDKAKAAAVPAPHIENLGHRTPNAIPRDTVAHSPIPEWDTILQVFINERKCSREDFQRFMLGVTPSPVVDGILPISVPEELYLYMSNTMGTKIRSVLGDLMPGIEARYDVAPRSVATA